MIKVLKLSLRIELLILFLSVIFWVISLASCSNSNNSNDEKDYVFYVNEVNGGYLNMPKIDEVGNFNNLSINRKSTIIFIWNIETVSLVLNYTEENFKEEIKKIYLKYNFVDETKENLTDFSASVDGYDINIVETEEFFEEYYCPKSFLMIGINENTNSILYMYYYDIDLDKIDNLDEFIKDYFIIG